MNIDRVANGTHRPALTEDAEGTLREMERSREALYAEVADLSISTSQRFDAVLEEILAAVSERESVTS